MSTENKLIKPLSSIRFFAALFVLLSHLGFLSNTNISFFMINEGFIGVTLFFILSGFILSYSYQDRLSNKTISISEFYIARIARIYPLHIITLLISIHFFTINITGITIFLSNILLLQAFIPHPDYYFSLNAPSWSISVEMFFYLLFPLFIKLNNRTLLLLSFTIIFVKIIIAIFSDELQHAMLYISPLLRLPDFLIGILIYRLRKNYPLELPRHTTNILQFTSIIILFVFVFMSDKINIAHRYDIYYIIPMGLIIFSLSFNSGVIADILSYRTIVYLGEASFSLYMTHQLIIRYLVEINEKYNILPIVYFFIFVILTCIITSLLFYKFIEKPIKKIFFQKMISISQKK
ncbi:acyltransferase [Morganella morganii]|uniref:acyltransferase family protein n=1 Tax=Morganella morganii TaxID=582 RepID=UPI00339C4BC7